MSIIVFVVLSVLGEVSVRHGFKRGHVGCLMHGLADSMVVMSSDVLVGVIPVCKMVVGIVVAMPINLLVIS